MKKMLLMTVVGLIAGGIAYVSFDSNAREENATVAIAEFASEENEVATIAVADLDSEDCEEVEETAAVEESVKVVSDENVQSEEDAVEADYEELVREVNETIEICKAEKNINDAFYKVYTAVEEYPEDEYLNQLKSTLIEQMPNTVYGENILENKSCVVGNDWVTGVDGEDNNTDFSINLGGGSLSVALNEKYSDICLTAILSNNSPTKASVDIEIYGDDQLLYSYEGFNTQDGKEEIWLSVGEVSTLKIVSGDHEYRWLGEASTTKTDTDCHFKLRMYEPRDLEWVK